MASYTCYMSTHQTLVAATADAVTLTGKWHFVEVLNRDSSTNDIYVRVDGVTAVSGANENYIVRPGTSRVIPVTDSSVTNTVVSVISAGAAAYTVCGQIVGDEERSI